MLLLVEGLDEPLGWAIRKEFRHAKNFGKDWHSYAVEVHKSGLVQLFVDNKLFSSFVDKRYTSGPVGVAPSCRVSTSVQLFSKCPSR